MEINNLASCWRAAALSVGEEEEGGKTALQIDTMAYAPTGKEGTEAGREVRRREVNTTNRGEIVSISGPKWDGDGEHKIPPPQLAFLKNLLFHPSIQHPPPPPRISFNPKVGSDISARSMTTATK